MASWLNRIVYTTLMDFYRKRKKTPIQDIPVPETDTNETSDNNPAIIACILELLQLLPEDQRELLKAIEIDGMKQANYARVHNLNPSTVKSRVQRAKQKIKFSDYAIQKNRSDYRR